MTRLQFNDEGKVYNSLKIIRKVAPRITSSGNKETRVEVECLACGTYKEVAWSKVKSGHTKSCGCIAEGRRKDITGTRFGSLVAQFSLNKKKKGSFLWECVCDCGNTKELTVSELNGGGYQSCGCLQNQGSPRDLKGQVFGRLTALESIGKNTAGQYIWSCSCSCGNTHNVTGTNLIEGNTKSCGCYAAEVCGKTSITHGMSHTQEYHAWKNALYRCTKPSNKSYKDYGGRGIKVCARWSEPLPVGFLNFLEDMGSCNDLTLEREDVNGDYCPDNCVWADMYTQGFNTRMHSTNTSGVTGVSQMKDGRWQSYINHMGKRIPLGYYNTFESAVSVRKSAELHYHGKNKTQ